MISTIELVGGGDFDSGIGKCGKRGTVCDDCCYDRFRGLFVRGDFRMKAIKYLILSNILVAYIVRHRGGFVSVQDALIASLNY